MLACSYDGSVAILQFLPDDMNGMLENPMSKEEMAKIISKNIEMHKEMELPINPTFLPKPVESVNDSAIDSSIVSVVGGKKRITPVSIKATSTAQPQLPSQLSHQSSQFLLTKPSCYSETAVHCDKLIAKVIHDFTIEICNTKGKGKKVCISQQGSPLFSFSTQTNVLCFDANDYYLAFCTADRQLNVFTKCGRKYLPSMILNGNGIFACIKQHTLMVVTINGFVMIWLDFLVIL